MSTHRLPTSFKLLPFCPVSWVVTRTQKVSIPLYDRDSPEDKMNSAAMRQNSLLESNTLKQSASRNRSMQQPAGDYNISNLVQAVRSTISSLFRCWFKVNCKNKCYRTLMFIHLPLTRSPSSSSIFFSLEIRQRERHILQNMWNRLVQL